MKTIMTDLKRAVVSLPFLICSVGITLLMIPAVTGLINKDSGVWYLSEMAIQGSGIETTIYFILPVLPFALSYALEKKSGADRFMMIRCGVARYALSKVMVSAISGFLVMLCGLLLFTLAFLPFLPLFTVPFSDGVYVYLAAQGQILNGFILYLIHYSLSGMLVAVCALWVSTIIPNKYVAAAAPLILYYTILRITSLIDISSFFNPIYWVIGVYHAQTPTLTILIKAGTTLALCALMGIAIFANIKRRLLHE